MRGFICCQILILTQRQQQQMIQVNSLTPLFEKIRSLCKECRNVPMPNKLQNGSLKLQQYLEALQLIRNQMIKFHELEEDYLRLQTILQSQQAMLRNKVGTEQQMKLYTESLKTHINQLSLEKLQLLQNSKEAIKQLKKVNEDLYSQLDSLKKGSAVKGRTSSLKTQSDKKADLSLIGIKDIVKTEYIDRPVSRQEARIKKSKPISHSFRLSEEPGKGIQFRQNSKTYQVIEPKTDREVITTSKKRQLSNFCPYIKISKKHQQQQLKSCYLTKDSEKNKKLKTKVKNVNRSLWKDKMANRSVASVGSMEAVSSQKQTL